RCRARPSGRTPPSPWNRLDNATTVLYSYGCWLRSEQRKGPLMGDVFDAEYADMEFSWDRVRQNAEQIGAQLGIPGPSFLPTARRTADTRTHRINGQDYTVRVATSTGVVTGRVSVPELAEQVCASVAQARLLHRRIRRMHETAPVWWTAVECEQGRVDFARALEPSRQ